LNSAITAPAVVALAAESGDQLAYADLAADDPVDRAARDHLLRSSRVVSRIHPAAGALGLPCRAKTAQVVEVLDTDGELQEVQGHRSGAPVNLAGGGRAGPERSARRPRRRDRRPRTALPRRRRRRVP